MRLLHMAVLALGALTLSGCDESLATLAGPTPDLEPTFASVQTHVFQSTDSAGRAACTGCHTNQGQPFPMGGLNLRTDVAYANLVGVRSTGKPSAVRVRPGDPENSYLVHKLEGRSDIAGVRMPGTGGPYLTDGQMAILKRWIAVGAPNN